MDKLIQMLTESGLPFAYDHFAEGESPEPPFLCYLLPGSDNFAADGAVYDETTDIGNLAAFVRSLIGLSQEAVNVKFGEYLNGNLLNSQQQEFVRTIINYVRENGDVELADMVNTEPFNNYDLNEIFGINLPAMIAVVRTLHDVVQAA